MKVVVVGGSGLVGKKLVPLLRQRGHEAVPASPSTGVNALTRTPSGAAATSTRRSTPVDCDTASSIVMATPPEEG